MPAYLKEVCSKNTRFTFNMILRTLLANLKKGVIFDDFYSILTSFDSDVKNSLKPQEVESVSTDSELCQKPVL